MNDRDCKNCAQSSPYAGIGNGCTAWDCEFISRREAIKAWRATRWIPVEEMLPEEDIPVLVAIKEKDRLPKWVEDQTYHYVTDIDVWDDGWQTYKKSVVAWMPLPEPYERGE